MVVAPFGQEDSNPLSRGRTNLATEYGIVNLTISHRPRLLNEACTYDCRPIGQGREKQRFSIIRDKNDEEDI
jgi:hypothetical protein